MTIISRARSGLAGSSAGQALTCGEQRNEEIRRPDVAGAGREGKGMPDRPILPSATAGTIDSGEGVSTAVSQLPFLNLGSVLCFSLPSMDRRLSCRSDPCLVDVID